MPSGWRSVVFPSEAAACSANRCASVWSRARWATGCLAGCSESGLHITALRECVEGVSHWAMIRVQSMMNKTFIFEDFYEAVPKQLKR